MSQLLQRFNILMQDILEFHTYSYLICVNIISKNSETRMERTECVNNKENHLVLGYVEWLMNE